MTPKGHSRSDLGLAPCVGHYHVTLTSRDLFESIRFQSPKEDRIRVAPSAGGSSSSDSDDSTESVNTKFYKKIAKEAKSSQSVASNLSANQQSNCNQSSKRCKSPDSTKNKLFSNPDTELRLTLRNVSSFITRVAVRLDKNIFFFA